MNEFDKILAQLQKKTINSKEKPYNKDEHRDLTRSLLAK